MLMVTTLKKKMLRRCEKKHSFEQHFDLILILQYCYSAIIIRFSRFQSNVYITGAESGSLEPREYFHFDDCHCFFFFFFLCVYKTNTSLVFKMSNFILNSIPELFGTHLLWAWKMCDSKILSYKTFNEKEVGKVKMYHK